MNDYISVDDQATLAAHGLDSFEALWAVQLAPVDEPNVGRGGWSSVFCLELGETQYFLKRQSNYLTRSWRRPLGEPTFSREFRSIQQFQRLGIPALQAAFFAQRRIDGQQCALLLTRGLAGWQDLAELLQHWPELAENRRRAIIQACAQLARQVHEAGQVHGCFYPKHIFLCEQDGGYKARLIDLEKTRSIIFGQRDKIKDIEPLIRRASIWGEAELQMFLHAYLQLPGDDAQVSALAARLRRQQRSKESRK